MNRILKFINEARTTVLAGILVALAFLQYGNTLGHDYAMDDMIVIGANERVKKGISGIPALFSRYESEQLEDQYGYRPITLSTFAIDQSVFGPSAFGGHLMNVVYFALLCIVMFLTLREIFPQYGQWLPFFITLLYLFHPIHVEAVANIKSRDEILSMLFSLLALRACLRFVDHRKWQQAAVMTACMGLAFLSKEGSVTMLAVFPLAVVLRTGVNWKAVLRVAAPVAGGLALLVLGLALFSSGNVVDEMAQTEGGGIVRESKIMGNAIFQPHQTVDRYATGTYILGNYLKNFLVPPPLVYYYGFNYLPITSFADPLVWLSILVHLGLLFLAWRSYR
ncbi:MAG: glycosyltransferase family 39 protein, partial [Bacteroidota bacterium]